MDKYDSRIMNLLTSMFNTMEVSDIMTDDIRKEYDDIIKNFDDIVSTEFDNIIIKNSILAYKGKKYV